MVIINNNVLLAFYDELMSNKHANGAERLKKCLACRVEKIGQQYVGECDLLSLDRVSI